MKKIHITEAQMNYIMGLNEVANQGAGIQTPAKPGANGKVTQQSLENQKRENDAQGLGNTPIVVDPSTLEENVAVFSKKQLKEVKKQSIFEKCSKPVSKKDLFK